MIPSEFFYREGETVGWRAAICRKSGQNRERVRWCVVQTGWEVRGDYCDSGDGTAIERLLSERRKYDVVAFPSLAAAGRDAKEVLMTLDRIINAELEFVSYREHIDSLRSPLIGWFIMKLAELERRKSRRRQPRRSGPTGS